MSRVFSFCFFILLLIPQILWAKASVDQSVVLAASKKGDFIYVVVLNSGAEDVRVGPMSYSAIRNDIGIFGHGGENLHLKNPVEMLSGKFEMEDWGIERHLKPGRFIGAVIPISFFKKRYRESGCHDMMFAYRYIHESGTTHSGKPIKLNVCW